MRRVGLSRRALLRGAGVGVALPVLDAMLDERGRFLATGTARAATPPPRFVSFFLPNGFPHLDNRFVPVKTGAGYAITPCLEPVASYVPDLTIVSGLTGSPGIEAHPAGITGFATGMECTTTASKGPSVEWLMVDLIGRDAPIPVLVVAADTSPHRDADGHSSVLYTNVSWQAAGQVAPAERDPRVLFDRLFTTGVDPGDTAALERLRRDRRSVLDLIKGDVLRLQARLGASDRLRLDAHLQGIRALERQLDLAAPVACRAPTAPAAVPTSQADRANLLVDLLAKALECDLTRCASFMFGHGGGTGGMDRSRGLTISQHTAAHNGDMEMMQLYTRMQMGAFARLLSRMKAASLGDGTLLDHSIVMCGTEIGDATAHTPLNLPYVLAGKGGGRLKTAGTHVAFPGAKHGSLHLSLLRLYGSPVRDFGRQLQTLPGIVS